MKPLGGITVVSVEQAVAAPFASRQLADLGARVIKIERPGDGDFARGYDTTVNGMASHFVWLNRSKESLTLDLKREEGATVLGHLLDRADVFLHNLAPGAMDRLGFGTDVLRQRCPRLISCGVSGYGSSGPYRDRKAYDLLIQSEAGLVSITGTEDTPSKVGISVADIAAGMYAFSGILTALITRQQTGRGLAMEVSMFDALSEWMGYPMYFAGYGGKSPRRAGASNAVIAPYGPYTAGDQRTVYFGIQNEREWVRFCEAVLERPAIGRDERFGTNEKRVANRGALDALIAETFDTLTADLVCERLDAAQIAYARMNSVHDLIDHPQLKARDRWRTIDSPVGPLKTLLPPFELEDVSITLNPIPAVGEHTARILSELGFDRETVDQWRRDGVI